MGGEARYERKRTGGDVIALGWGWGGALEHGRCRHHHIDDGDEDMVLMESHDATVLAHVAGYTGCDRM